MHSSLAAHEVLRVVCAGLIAVGLAVRGRRRGSLSPSGAAAAFLVGFLSWASSVRFGATLIVFYLSSTKATRFRAEEKEKYEDDVGGPGGNRNAIQVLASSAPAVVVSVCYLLVYRYDAPIQAVFATRAYLLLSFMLFFAACCGDTYASELGSVLPPAGECPVLITNPFVRVPRGTNGGVTWQGTVASGVGGLVIGLTFYLLGPDYGSDQLSLLVCGAFGGAVGSLLDSFLGALLQISLVDEETGKVLKHAPKAGSPEARRTKHICGRDLLSGEMVNCMAACGTAAFAPLLVAVLF